MLSLPNHQYPDKNKVEFEPMDNNNDNSRSSSCNESSDQIFMETEGDEFANYQFKKKFKYGEDMEETFRCEDLKSLEAPFWLTCFSCCCTYIAVINQIVIGSGLL